MPFRRGRGLRHRPIRLLHFPQAEHVGQPRKGLGGASVQDDAAHRPVEAVHGPNEGITGFVVLPFDVLADDAAEGGIAAGVALDNVRRAFVDGMMWLSS